MKECEVKMDSIWAIILLALIGTNDDNNKVNYLDKYNKYGDDKNV